MIEKLVNNSIETAASHRIVVTGV